MAKKDRREQMAADTRRDILSAARQLFADRGYAATSIIDIAEKADVAVQTIYSRLGSKRGIVLALLELIEDDARVAETVAAIPAAATPEQALRAGIHVMRGFPEHAGDIIYSLLAAAVVEPDVAAVIELGQHRHRDGARAIIDRIAALGGLRQDLPRAEAVALLAALTWNPVWAELVDVHGLSWDEAEDRLTDTLGRTLLESGGDR